MKRSAAKGCSSTNLDHGVAVVGYNTMSNGGDYWIVRNSWGESWGENGYVYVEEGSNVCGITAQATISNAAGVATIKEKESVAALFCKLASLLRDAYCRV